MPGPTCTPHAPPLPCQVLVKFAYAGINGGCETFRARGEHAFAANRTKQLFPLGAEGSGVVAALGADVRGLSVGQAVAVNGASAFAEFAIASPQLCTPVPAATPEAAALVLSGVVAAAALEATARVAPGEVVLVTAAAGGAGHFAVQLARLAGARVVAVTSSAAKAAALQQLGPERVISYKEEVRWRGGACMLVAFKSPAQLRSCSLGAGAPACAPRAARRCARRTCQLCWLLSTRVAWTSCLRAWAARCGARWCHTSRQAGGCCR